MYFTSNDDACQSDGADSSDDIRYVRDGPPFRAVCLLSEKLARSSGWSNLCSAKESNKKAPVNAE